MTGPTPPASTPARGAQDAAHPEDLLDPAGAERVTRFPWRQVALPGGAGAMALITMDNGTGGAKPATLGPAGLLELRATLDEVEALVAEGSVAAVGITGVGSAFAAGADLGHVVRISTRPQALGVARHGHDSLRRLGELGAPSFAFVNGTALGGGLEVALHCTHRTAAAGARPLGLPEIALGLVPGWGGTHLLPGLVGIPTALRWVVGDPLAGGRTSTAERALADGVVDVVLDPARFLEESIAWAARVLTGEVVVERPQVDRDAAAWDGAIAAARAQLDARLHGAAPAPYRALDLLARARTDDREAGFAAEDDALAELVVSEEFRAGAYSFDLVQRRAKRPAGAPDASLARPVRRVGVVGAGLMASQLALLFARRLGVPVVMTDLDAERVARGLAWVHGQVDELAAGGGVSADAATGLKGLVTGTTSYQEAFAGADIVIEAVFEEMGVKQQVLTALEQVVPDECVLATNTSSLSVTAMASVLRRPERMVGFHVFNPVARMPLVEVVRTAGEAGRPGTDDAVLATAFALGRQLGKSCVLVRDAPAFVVNRLLLRLIGEVLAAVDEGTPPEVADAATDPLGLPMSPFALLGLVGPPVALHVARTLHEAFPDRFGVSGTLQRIVEAGLPGVWAPDARGRRVLAPETAAVLQLGDHPSTAEQVRERALAALAREVRLMLDEGVVAEPQDVDLCMLLGAGWPFHLGGITPHLDRTGVSQRATGARFLPPGVASLPAP
ncbi:3-hydroxyacyl-CoA dehydrogenase NAD-binding domain-containing protein [Quadrisphaera sp. DSM 44207]|uniref:3-hydroxyacyl-CoA dehydrogenase NAD-binding domain-containing protein n=1 Tax=Quadrisphaera sp. DSM 44207 TaxID=1881057 RepID=UPI00088AF147|nr:3-hydroxyacyl-CoA dehydrogenase NAD-binding domain-containing protein [Quadrisphaera sp. DSM 44207]SDQ49655.1 3-hydroxyacyl-CoA dehydrogenase [Quadrisphaera sp. DSM 44207]